MDRVAGRVADFLVREDGARVAGVSLIENTLTKMPGIGQMQILQRDLHAIQLRVVPESTFTQAVRQQLIEYFEATFTNARIDLELVGAIPREPNGKYRFAKCEVAI
jgi:phenylacetate-CoA ligase